MSTADIDHMMRFHEEGLRRVAKVIQGNPDYDALMDHKLTHVERDMFADFVSIDDRRRRAISSVEIALRTTKPQIILPQFSGLVCDGNTKNNLREFAFFQRTCAPFAGDLLSQNYSFLPRIAAGRLSVPQERALDRVASDLKRFYQSTGEVTAALVHQQVAYSRHFFSMLLSVTARGAIRPDALLLANDHSPARVATSMVFKAWSVPRIYVQHAEITENFPSLDFEYSVLRNQRSLEVYRKIGNLSGRVFVIPRAREQFDAERLSRLRLSPVTVVIYPTARFLVEPLKDIIRKLAANTDVAKVIIKEHPGAPGGLANLTASANVSVSDKEPEEDHIAIVGNSSVAVELLHRGTPVYQNFDFDPVARDYYGLVASGVTSEVCLDDLERAFWKPYDLGDEWLKAYACLDASATDHYLQETRELVEEMSTLIACPATRERRQSRMRGWIRAGAKSIVQRSLVGLLDANPQVSSKIAGKALLAAKKVSDWISLSTDRVGRYLSANTKIRIGEQIWRIRPERLSLDSAARSETEPAHFLLEILAQVDNPVVWLLKNEQAGLIPGALVIDVLDTAIRTDHPAWKRIKETRPQVRSRSAVINWVYLRDAELTRVALTREEVAVISEVIENCNSFGVKSRLAHALKAATLSS